MIATAHAVTPSDSREAPARASDNSDSGPGEMLDELSELALELADEAARADLECCCRQTRSGPHDWYDPRQISSWSEHDEWLVNRALRYLQLRGEPAAYRVVRSQAFPSLLRFEARS